MHSPAIATWSATNSSDRAGNVPARSTIETFDLELSGSNGSSSKSERSNFLAMRPDKGADVCQLRKRASAPAERMEFDLLVRTPSKYLASGDCIDVLRIFVGEAFAVVSQLAFTDRSHPKSASS